MATGGSDSASDEIITVKCCVCAKKNITKEAEKYCVQCQDYYCVPCTDMHKMFPAMGGHQILDKADFRSHGLQSSDLPCLPTERCSVHKTKLLDMYCGNHDEVVCATCVALSHKSCHDIHSVPENVDKIYNQTVFNETSRKLKATMKTMNGIKQANENLVRELKKSRDEAIDSIRKFRMEMEAIMEKLEKKSIKEVEAVYATIAAELQNKISEAEKHANGLTLISSKLEKSTGNKAQEFVCIKSAEKSIYKFEEGNNVESTNATEAVFLPDTNIKNFLQHLTTFGQVSTSQTSESKVYVVNGQKKINVKLPEDTYRCVVFGSCFTSDGCLLLTDHDNKKLKRVAFPIASVKDHVDVDARPYAVCQISNAEAAVSLKNNTVQFVSLGDKMITTRQLKFDHRCNGLASKDEKMYISDRGSAVYIYDMSGVLVRQIETDESGNAIFGTSFHISLSRFGEKVYIADQSKGLVTLDIHGNYESTFTDPELVKPCGVCIDGKGNIFVCGMSDKVVQVNEESQTKLSVLNLTFFHSVCFDPRSSVLVLTLSNNDVRTYELQKIRL